MKILNFGSLNIDRVYQVDNFVKAGETISSLSMKFFPGGKGLNQTVAIARAGGEVYHAGCIGHDGELLENCLKEDKVSLNYIQKVDESSGHAIIQVSPEGQNAIIVYPGANAKVGKKYIDSVLNDFEKGDIILLQNEISNVGYIMERAHELGLRIAFNPSPITGGINSYPLGFVDIFILNEIEGAALTGKTEIKDILDILERKYPNAQIVLTLGEKGSCYKYRETYAEFGIYKNNVVDTTAAGDTFCGYFLTCISKDVAPVLAIQYASAASSIAVSKEGASTSVPYMEQVEEFMKLRGNI